MSKSVQVSLVKAAEFDNHPQATIKKWHSIYGTSSLSPHVTPNSVVINCGRRVLAILVGKGDTYVSESP